MFEIQNVLMQQPVRMLLHREDLLILVQVVHVVALIIIVTFIRIVLQTQEHIQEVPVDLLLLILVEVRQQHLLVLIQMKVPVVLMALLHLLEAIPQVVLLALVVVILPVAEVVVAVLVRQVVEVATAEVAVAEDKKIVNWDFKRIRI